MNTKNFHPAISTRQISDNELTIFVEYAGMKYNVLCFNTVTEEFTMGLMGQKIKKISDNITEVLNGPPFPVEYVYILARFQFDIHQMRALFTHIGAHSFAKIFGLLNTEDGEQKFSIAFNQYLNQYLNQVKC
jgi:hypothetical protein